MNRITSFFREKGFRGLLKRNFTTVLAILLIPTLVSFVFLIVLFNRIQYSSLLSQAESSLVRIASQTDVLLNDLDDLALTTNYAENTTAFRKYVDVALSGQKLASLQRLQSSLQTDDSKSSTLLYRTESNSFLVTAQTATTLWSVEDLSAYGFRIISNAGALRGL